MLFDNNNMDYDFTFLNIADLNKPNHKDMNVSYEKFVSAKEGFLRGNMFKDEYLPYKNMTYVEIKPKNDREAKLYNVMQYAFAITDLNLYLDLHPSDMSALNMLKELIKEEEMVKKEYVNSYGPLDVCEVKGNKFNWIDSPWSWEKLGGNMYV